MTKDSYTVHLVVISSECRTAVFVQHNVLIPSGNRCCPAHVKDGLLTNATIEQLPTTNHAFVNITAILNLIQHIRVLYQRNEKKKKILTLMICKLLQILTVCLCLDLVWTISKRFVTV